MYRYGILDLLKSAGVEIHARSIFLQGLFYLPIELIKKKYTDGAESIIALNEIAKSGGLRLSELSLLWVSSLDSVDKIVIGVDNLEQLKRHKETLQKDIDKSIFVNAIKVIYENEKILNPSLWPVIS